MKKVIEINPFLLGTMAGGAADCQFWLRNLGIQVGSPQKAIIRTELWLLDSHKEVAAYCVHPKWDLLCNQPACSWAFWQTQFPLTSRGASVRNALFRLMTVLAEMQVNLPAAKVIRAAFFLHRLGSIFDVLVQPSGSLSSRWMQMTMDLGLYQISRVLKIVFMNTLSTRNKKVWVCSAACMS